MGEVVGAGIVSHVPTIMLPEETRRELNGGEEISLVPGFHRLRHEVLDVLEPDTFIVFDTHCATLLEFIVPAHERRSGKFTSEELPHGMSQVPYDMKGNPELAHLLADAINAEGIRSSTVDDPCLPIHYGTINVAHYLNSGEEWLSIGVCMTADADDYLRVGRGIGKAIQKSDRRVVLLASGSMSHRFYPLKEILKYESSNPALVYPGNREADMRRLDWFYAGNHADVIDTMDEYYAARPEGNFGHYLMMVGAIGGRDCKAIGRLFSDYENAVGTSQVHVWFDRPEDGWAGAG